MATRNKEIGEFAERWAGRGYEKGEAVKFWEELQNALGYASVYTTSYEVHLDNGGYVDAWLRDASTIVEQKSLDVDLDKPELRQGKMKTPLEQALDYVDELRPSEQPRFVVTCNFETFRVYDRNECSRSQLAGHVHEFTLDELGEHPEYLGFVTDPANARIEREREISIRAGERVGQLYDRLRGCYADPDSAESLHSLNVLCVRIVFCLFCEDSDLFERNAFYNYLSGYQAPHIRKALLELFKALDTPIKDRDPYDTELLPFPYVNGGLFRDVVEIPQVDEETRAFLLEDLSAGVDWSEISPTIFGGIFESTLNPETRRSGGMHYTSPENIHKVIDPLFLDELRDEFSRVHSSIGTTPRKRKNTLRKLHQRICHMNFFDPACGSGNFLTETYICLRRLEDAILRDLNDGQRTIGFAEDEDDGARVSLGQFHGIEINDFAVTVAETALWISRLKANGESMTMYDGAADDFPLHERADIVHGNALRVDWNEVLPASQCSFIMGNPPFVGHQWRSGEQQDDMALIFDGYSKYGKLDYVCAWYAKAASFIKSTATQAALVSTNSICQGESVQILWGQLSKRGVVINFAWPSFKWTNEASDQAGVAVVIIGFSCNHDRKDKTIHYSDGVKHVRHINGYLVDGEDIYIQSRSKPLNDGSPEMTKGSQPTDGGGLLLNSDARAMLLRQYPELEAVIRPYMGGDEFIKRKERWCLWFDGVDITRYEHIPEIQERLALVQSKRIASPTKSVKRDAATPWLFTQRRQPNDVYMAVPEVSSENREYIPVGFVEPKVIASNQLRYVPTNSLYLLGLTLSKAHMAWMRVVSGRLESRYRYSPAVWNSFVWPESTDTQRQTIETCAQAVLDARANHPEYSLATLYDPDKMPADLLAAHRALDAAVEAAYGVDFGGDEEKIVAHLFKLYAEKVGEGK